MTNFLEQFRFRRQARADAQPVQPIVGTATDTGISPQEFYREMVERPDVRRILTRLAQVKDGGA